MTLYDEYLASEKLVVHMAHPVRVNTRLQVLDGNAYLGGGVNLMHISNVFFGFGCFCFSGEEIWDSLGGGG